MFYNTNIQKEVTKKIHKEVSAVRVKGSQLKKEIGGKDMKEEIIRELESAVKEAVGEGCEVEGNVVRKNNGVRFQAVNIRKPGGNLSPIIYIDGYIDEIIKGSMTVEDAARNIASTYEDNKESMPGVDAGRLVDKEFVLSHVEYQLVNKALNSQRIAVAPHKDILDLSALFKVVVSSDESGTAGFVIGNEIFDRMGVSIEELDQAAARNTEKTGFEVKTIAERMAEIMNIPAEAASETGNVPQMFILTNKKRINGAVVLMYGSILRELSDRVGDDLFILPSSIHEVLAVPASQNDLDELVAMVSVVNNREVFDEEILGYSVYRYARATGELSIA